MRKKNIITCDSCKKDFQRNPCEVNEGSNYCSKQCYFDSLGNFNHTGIAKLYSGTRLLRRMTFQDKGYLRKLIKEWRTDFADYTRPWYISVMFHDSEEITIRTFKKAA